MKGRYILCFIVTVINNDFIDINLDQTAPNIEISELFSHTTVS